MIPQNVLRNFKVVDVNIKNHPDYQKLEKKLEELEKELAEKKSYSFLGLNLK